ncbi:MAG: cyclophilin-type peptidylprolyl cis-trans isomerase, peptidylprolyl isomerase [Chloroflexi bacterium]|nr:cyclophilin-type peptidylprolyl cis-trans isomerase, peptidylprolyl isomerase [Chloroflexota bacterium]
MTSRSTDFPGPRRATGARPARRTIFALSLVLGLALVVGACSLGTQVSSTLSTVGDPVPGADGCPTSQPAALPAGETRTVEIKTAKGTITLKIDGALSPIAAGNFVALAECGYYNGVVFHRAATLQDGTPFVIQGGDPTGTGSGGPGYAIQDEQVTATYARGTLAMARSAQPNSQGSQFFIVLSDASGSILASYNTYAIFGEVTAGMEVADAIHAAADAELPTNPIAMDEVTVSNP